MSDSTYLNLVRGNTLGTHVRLEMTGGKPFRYARDYTYVEIPLGEIYNMKEEEVVDKAVRNQKLRIIPACTVNVRDGYKLLVRVNPKLHEFADCPALFLLDPGDAGTPSFYASFNRDMDADELDWAVRIYLQG